MSQQVQVEGQGIVEFPDDAKPEEIQEALNRAYPPPPAEQTSATGAFTRSLAQGVAPSAAFVAGFEAVAPPVTELALPTGWLAPVIGGGAGLVAGGGAAALTAYGQGKLLRAVAPGLAAKLQAKQAADVAQHPVASMGGELASMLPSAELSIPKLAQIPFRAGVGGTIAAVQPLITERRAPTARDIAGGALAATIFGRGRFRLLPRATKAAAAAIKEGAPDASSIQEAATVYGDVRPQPGEGAGQVPAKEGSPGVQPKAAPVAETAQVPLSLEDQAHIDAERGTVDVPVDVVAAPSNPADPFASTRAGQFMGINRAKGSIEIYPQEFSEWLKSVPVDRRALAVRSALSEERIHLATTPEQASAYWSSLTGLEKAIERRTYQGHWQARPDVGPTDLGFEAIRARMQRLARMDRREIAESALKERWTLRSLQALEDTVRVIREGLGTKASREGLAILGRVQDGIDAAKAAISGQSPAAIRRRKEPPQTELFLPPIPKGAAAPREAFEAAPDFKLVQAAAADFVNRSKTAGKGPVFEDFAGELRAKFGGNVREDALHNAWYDVLGKEPPEALKKEWKRAAVWPEDIAQEYVVTEPSRSLASRPSEEGAGIRGEAQDFTPPTVETSEQFRRLNAAEATPEWLSTFVKKGGRTFKAPVSVSKNLVAFRNEDGRVALVSGYFDPRRGSVVTNPHSATGPNRVIDQDLLRGSTPIAAMSLRAPVQHFRQSFPTEEAFWKHFGDLGAREAPAGVEPAEPTMALPAQAIARPTPVPEPLIETARELTTPGRTRPIPVGRPLYRSPRPSPIPAELLTAEGQRAVAAQAAERFPPMGRPVAPEIGKPIRQVEGPNLGSFITEHGQPAKMGPGWPLRAGVEGTVLGRRTPAAIRRIPQSAKDELAAIGASFRKLKDVHNLVGEEAALLDAADNTKNIVPRTEATRIRMASLGNRALGKVEGFLMPFRGGDKQVLAAANVLVEAGFDHNKLREFRINVNNGLVKARAMANGATFAERRQGAAWVRHLNELGKELDYATAHWNDWPLRQTALRMRDALRGQLQLERSKGYDIKLEQNYLPHRYDPALWTGEHWLFFRDKVWGKKFQTPREFPSYYAAAEAGPYIAVTRDGASLVEHRMRQGIGMMLHDQWFDAMKSVVTPDGRPLAIDTVEVPGERGRVKSPDPAYDVVQTGPGRPDTAILSEYAKPIANLINPSYVETSDAARKLLHMTQMLKHTLLIGDFFHLARVSWYGLSLMGRKAGWKGGWSALDIQERDIPEAVAKGIISAKDAAWGSEQIPFGQGTITRRELVRRAYAEMGANLGKIQDALYKDLVTDLTPTAGPIRKGLVRLADPTIGTYNRFLFDGLTRGLMAESIARQFEAQTKANPGADPKLLLRDISKDINNFFGNIGRQGIFRSKSAQDMARLFFLAPNWVEGLIRKEASTYGRLAGAPIRGLTGQRKGLSALGATGSALVKGVALMVGITQAINLISRGKPTWENDEKEHKFDAWVPGIGSDKEGFWFSPLAVYMELTHDLYRIIETKPKVMDAFDQIVANKESPLSRATMVLLTGKTPTGELTSTSGGQLASATKALVPMPITFGRLGQAAGHAIAPGLVPATPPGAVQRQLMTTFAGIKAEPGQTEPQKMQKLARDFMVANGLTKDSGWQQVQTDQPSYSKLRSALRANDEQRARKILNELRKSHTDPEILKAMKMNARRPFTGSRKNERLFIASLNDRELEAYSNAVDQKLADFNKFLEFYARQP